MSLANGALNYRVRVTFFSTADVPGGLSLSGLVSEGRGTAGTDYTDDFTVTGTSVVTVTGSGCSRTRSGTTTTWTLTASSATGGVVECLVSVAGGAITRRVRVTFFDDGAGAGVVSVTGLVAEGRGTPGTTYTDPFTVSGVQNVTATGSGCSTTRDNPQETTSWTLRVMSADSGIVECLVRAGHLQIRVTVTFLASSVGGSITGLARNGSAVTGTDYTDDFTATGFVPTAQPASRCTITTRSLLNGEFTLTVDATDPGVIVCRVTAGLATALATVLVTDGGASITGLAATGTAVPGTDYTDEFTALGATPITADAGCTVTGPAEGTLTYTLTVVSAEAGAVVCEVAAGPVQQTVTVTFTAVTVTGLQASATLLVGATHSDVFVTTNGPAALADDADAACQLSLTGANPGTGDMPFTRDYRLTVTATTPGDVSCDVVAGGVTHSVTITFRAAASGTLADLAASYRCTNTDTGPEVAYTAGDTRLAFRLEYGAIVATWTADVPTVVTGWTLWLRDFANTDDVDVYGFPTDIGAGTAATTTSTTWRASEADTGLPNAFVGIDCIDLDPLGVEFLPSALSNLIAPLLGVTDGYWDGTFTWATSLPTVDLCLDRRIPNAAGSAWGSSFAVDTGGNTLFTASCVFPTGAGGALWIALVNDDGVALGFQFQLIARASTNPTEAKFQALGKVWLQFGTSDTSGGSIEVDMAEGCLDYEAGDTACAVLVTADIDGGVSSRIIGHQLRSVKRGAAPDVPEAFAPLVRNEDEPPGEAPELPEITIPGDPEAGEGPSFAEAWAMASQRFDECIATLRGWEVGDLYDPGSTPVTWNPLSWGRWIAQTSADAVVGAISRLGTLVIGGAWVVVCAIYAFIFGTPAGVLNIASRIGSGQCAAPPAVPSRIVDGERVTPMLQTTWIDADNDGAIDAGELHSGYEGRSTTCLGVALMAWPVESLRRASGDDYGPVQNDDTEPMSAAVCAAAGHVDQGCPPPCGGPVLPVGTVTGGAMASVIDSSVWIDANNDGIRDPDEVTTNPDPDPFTAPTTTVINGVTYQDVNGYRMRWTGTDAGYSPDQTSLNLSYFSVCSPDDDNPRRALADGVRPWAERILLVVFLLWFLRILWRFVKLFDLTSPTDHRSLQNDLDP